MKVNFLAVIACGAICICHCVEERNFYLNEVGVGFGRAEGQLRRQTENYGVTPCLLRLGFALNKAWGFPSHKGALSFVLEPFYNAITEPRISQEMGVGLMFQYAYPMIGTVHLYGEAGVGPMFFGLETVAQGTPGFNFLDQGGVGIKMYSNSREQSFNIGYRYRHISHGRLRNAPNGGVDTQALIVSYSMYR